MKPQVKVFVGLVATAAAGVLGAGLATASWSHPELLALWMVLGVASSTRKVAVPGLNASCSLNALVLLAAGATVSLAYAGLTAVSSAAVQSYWKPGHHPKPIQLLFNASNLVISTGAAWLLFSGSTWNPSARLFLGAAAACLYYAINVGLTSVVIHFVSDLPLGQVWEAWKRYWLHYYVVSASVAILFSMVHISLVAQALALSLPLLVVLHRNHRAWVSHSR